MFVLLSRLAAAVVPLLYKTRERYFCLQLMMSPSINLISLPFSHPTCDCHDVKIFLFRVTSPKVERKIFILGSKGQFWGYKKLKTKIGLMLTLVLKHVKQFYKLKGL